MKIKQEILDRSNEEDKPILLWLFERYHMASEWKHVAYCNHVRYGDQSYQSKRVWFPQEAGKKLYFFSQLVDALEKTQNMFGSLVVANKLHGTKTKSGLWEDELDIRSDANVMLLKQIKGEK